MSESQKKQSRKNRITKIFVEKGNDPVDSAKKANELVEPKESKDSK